MDKTLGEKEVKSSPGLGIGRILHMDTEIANICERMGESVSQELKLPGQRGVTGVLSELGQVGCCAV